MVLRNIYFELSGSCNLSCHHCYIFNDNKKRARPDRLSPELIERVLLEGRSIGLSECTFTGGEILLRPDFLEILQRSSKVVGKINLLSNLTLLSPRYVEALKDFPIGIVSTSIDGLSQVHDTFRGRPGAFQKTFSNLLQLRDAGIPVKASVTIGNHNLNQAADVFALLRHEQIPFSIARISPVGRGTGLAPDHDEAFHQDYTRLLAEELQRAISTAEILNAVPPAEVISNHCGVGIDILYVMSDGLVGFCPTLAPFVDGKFEIGDVTTTSLVDIWDGGRILSVVSSTCANQTRCSHGKICRSGCRANAYALTGDLEACDIEMKSAFDRLSAEVSNTKLGYRVV